MSRYILLREKGSADTLLIDKATLSVIRLDDESIKAVDEFKGDTTERLNDVEFAFSVDYRSKAPARMFYREEAPIASVA